MAEENQQPEEDDVFEDVHITKEQFDKFSQIPPLEKVDVPDRITSVVQIVFQPDGAPPFQISSRGWRIVNTKDEDPYQKTYRGSKGISKDPQKIKLAWLQDCPGIILIENTESKQDESPLLVEADGFTAKIFPGDPPFIARLDVEVLNSMRISYQGKRESIAARVTCFPE